MAVIQISRIQIRRGLKEQASGLPQLASGELGWAVDAQELFIGNGSVSEGSPYVGNTQILTQHDDLFQYASNYSYRVADGFIDSGSTLRSLQDRLDDRVSVRSFGAVGDGVTDDTIALQRAIDQLFLNNANKTNPRSRVILHLEPGAYRISSTIYIPPNATIVGAGPGKTMIQYTSTTGPVFKTTNSTGIPGTPAVDGTEDIDTQATNILLKGMTISCDSTISPLQLVSCRDSVFEDLAFTSGWSFGVANTNVNNAILFTQLSGAVACKNNRFEAVNIAGFANGVYADWDIIDNVWNNCDITRVSKAFLFGYATDISADPSISGQETGPKGSRITNSRFIDYEKQAIHVVNGVYNETFNNKFYQGGSDGGAESNTLYPVIQFDTVTNESHKDWFARSAALGDLSLNPNTAFIPEVKNTAINEIFGTHDLTITQSLTYSDLFKLPADGTKSLEVDYIYKSTTLSAVRTGVLTINIDPVNSRVLYSDDYDYLSASISAVDDESSAFKLKATLADKSGDSLVDTVVVQMLNSTSETNAKFYYRVKTKT